MGLSSGEDLHCITLSNFTLAVIKQIWKMSLNTNPWLFLSRAFCLCVFVDITSFTLKFNGTLNASLLQWVCSGWLRRFSSSGQACCPNVSSLSLITSRDEQPSITEFIFSLCTEPHYSPRAQRRPCYRLPTHTFISYWAQLWADPTWRKRPKLICPLSPFPSVDKNHFCSNLVVF